MRASARAGRRLGVPAAAALSLILAGTVPALADDNAAADTTAPVVTSTGLTAGQIVPRQLVLHPVATDDVALTTVLVSAGSGVIGHCTIDPTQALTCPVTFPTSLNGTDTDVTVRAFDKAGNRGDLTTNVHIDAVALSGTLTPPAASAMRTGPVAVTLSNVSPETTQIDMTDGPNGAALATLTAAPWTFTWNATESAASPCFRLSDPVGNVTTYCPDYIVSDQPPVITAVAATNTFYSNYVWSSELDNGTGWIGADGWISPFVTDKAGIDHTELWVDGVLQATSTSQMPMFAWHNTTPGKTSANVEIRVTDRVGLTTSKAFRLNIDNTGPVIKVSLPNGSLVRGTKITVTETETDQHRIMRPPAGFAASPVSRQDVITLSKDGPLPLYFDAYDELGNLSELTSTLIVDNTPPTVAFATAPANNAHLSSTVRLTATSSDKNGIAKIQLLVNGHVIATSTNPKYAFALVPSRYGKRFDVVFRAYDKAGNYRNSSTRYYNYR